MERLIAYLNDDHHWRREKIADWVAKMEVKVVCGAQQVSA